MGRLLTLSRRRRWRRIMTPARTVSWLPVSLLSSKVNKECLRGFLRVLELAHAAELFALDTSRVVWVALDLLLAASDASNGESLPGFACFGHAPVGVDCLSIDHGLAVTAVVIEVAHSFSGHLRCSDKPRKKVGSRPDLRTKAIFRRDGFRVDRAAAWCRRRKISGGMSWLMVPIAWPTIIIVFLSG